MFGPEYNLVFFLHQLAYSQGPLRFEDLNAPTNIEAFEAALSRGLITATHSASGTVIVALNAHGRSYIGLQKKISPQTRFLRWALSWWRREGGARGGSAPSLASIFAVFLLGVRRFRSAPCLLPPCFSVIPVDLFFRCRQTAHPRPFEGWHGLTKGVGLNMDKHDGDSFSLDQRIARLEDEVERLMMSDPSEGAKAAIDSLMDEIEHYRLQLAKFRRSWSASG